MDHIKILKRAFSITWGYRALWVFGVLLALTLPRNGGGSNSGFRFSGDEFNGGQGFPNGIPPIPEGVLAPILSALVTIGIALLCGFFIIAIVATIIRYISETALIRMVDMNEASEEKVSVGAGFRLGWSRPALRLFLIDLLIGVVGLVALILLLAVAATPLLVWLTKNEFLRVLGTVVGIGMILLVIMLFILLAILLSVVMHFIRRAAVLEDMGMFEAMRHGVILVRQRLLDIVIMALIMFALGLAWVVVGIPFFILLMLVALVLGGLPALFAGLITSLFTQGALPWIIAIAVGLPIFLVVMIVPSTFVGGLYETFKSSTWTLTYREVVALGGAGLKTQGDPPDESPASTDAY
jgi:hypothetical protein